ncbi:MAG TPA: phosphoenolpyruvate--protein phosphotransferase [Solirubrobacteraceae bacterium]|nr:phosphoenolpyruvate--protein phosphotransferase [Solirubrobacteraceae bacterium]
MVGLVIVSHSATLAAGVVELARQMGGEDVAIEAAGGMADPPGAIGTDMALVLAAIEAAASDDGVLVLMDLGSAVMSAEMAAEMVEGTEVLLCEAPLVEGAVAAAARARTGASLAEVAGEARSAIGMKAAQLGVETPDAAAPASDQAAPAADLAAAEELRIEVPNRLGLHARPAARFVETAGRFDATVTVADQTTGRGPADARSLSALITLGVHQGHEILVRAAGPEATQVLTALRELADTGFGDDNGDAPVAPAPPPPPPTAATGTLQGVPAASGIAIAPARRLKGSDPFTVTYDPDGTDPAAEWSRLEAARAAARTDIEAARAQIAAQVGEGEAGIFNAHLLLLDDAALLGPAKDAVDAGASAAAAWGEAARATADAYRGLDDPYLQERATDVEDVGGRVLRHLVGGGGAPAITEPGILVVRDLTPGDAAALDRDLVQGLAVARGGATSHAAILARALGIPSVVGLGEGLLGVEDGTMLIVDGDAGTVELDPPADELAARRRDQEEADRRAAAARERAREPARLRDGDTIEVAANLGSVAEAAAAVELGADGVGLLRTEFLFLDREQAPSEEEQRAVYEEIAAALGGRPVIIRTLDAGADKPLPFLKQAPEDNPFLGVRGIRLGLANPELLRAQLRAIAAVAERHPVKVMFPMVATLDEFRAARRMLDADVEVGVMLEVPAVALQADAFAREVDFFSVGTNDLTQYTMAAERGNEALAPLLAGPQAPVLKLIAGAVEAANAHGRWVGVCGELAGDPEAAVILTGLGVRELSMAAGRIPAVKDALRAVSRAEARAAAARALG